MQTVALPRVGTVAAWRDKARALASQGVPTDQVLWQIEGTADGDLFSRDAPTATQPGRTLKLPRKAIDSLETALCHSDPERFARAYSLVLRLADGSLRWGDRTDPAMHL
ncbi:MAG TPA: uracil-DNA glycosylase, partial [Tabrizicola sp.]|nr:uracil-DNA glycosylase [Tabrizicola sp.]